jgi:hypothetical protein
MRCHVVLHFLANAALALVCVAAFVRLPFGEVVNAVISGVLWVGAGFLIDRWHLSLLSVEDRAAELRRRADSEP